MPLCPSQCRELHENRRVTLVRGLMMGVPCVKDSSGLPLGILETELVRRSIKTVDAGQPTSRVSQVLRAREEALRSSRTSHGVALPVLSGPDPPAASNRASWGFLGAASNLRESLETRNSVLFSPAMAEEDLHRIRTDRDLSEAERWGYARQVEIARAKELRSRRDNGRLRTARTATVPRMAQQQLTFQGVSVNVTHVQPQHLET